MKLTGHSGKVTHVAFSPGGQRVASASYDESVKIWDTATGQELLTLKGGDGVFTCVAFSSNGDRVAAASTDKTVKVWDTTSGQELLTLKGHEDRLQSVAYSGEGDLLASAGGEVGVRKPNDVKIWSAATGEELVTLKGHERGITCVNMSPDGKYLASASFDETVMVWSTDTGQELLTLKAPVRTFIAPEVFQDDLPEPYANKGINFTDVAFSPDGKRLASVGYFFAQSTSFETTKPKVTQISVSAVQVWNATNGEAMVTVKADEGQFASVAFSPDGTQLVTIKTGPVNRVIVFDSTTGQEVRSFDRPGCSQVVFSPDGKTLAAAAEVREGLVYLWDVMSDR